MSRDKVDKVSLVLERAKKFLGLKTDTALAERMGITQSALAQWKKRGSVNYGPLISVCHGVNYHWLLTGEGSMRAGPVVGGPVDRDAGQVLTALANGIDAIEAPELLREHLSAMLDELRTSIRALEAQIDILREVIKDLGGE